MATPFTQFTHWRTAAAAALLFASAAHTVAAQHPAGRELTADEQVLHALNRLTYGPRPGDAARIRAMGVDRWIAQQLDPASVPDTAAERLLAPYAMLQAEPAEVTAWYRQVVQMRRAAARDSAPSQGNGPRRAPTDAQAKLREAVTDVESAKLVRAVASEHQLEELLADFWANHFSVFKGKGQTRLYIAHYDREVIRPHAMGKFRDLLGAVAKSPAMLFYLDNARSVAERPGRPRGLNENYARELLELHTLGVDGGYTQQDVREVARAFTGWTIEPREGEFVFRPAAHDREAKTVLGKQLRANRGIEDGEEVLDLVARHPATARHVARKLVMRFVSDSPPPALVARAAATFTRTDGDLREVVRTIVSSDEFWSRDAWRAKVKTPFELVASTYRALGAVPDSTPRATLLVARLGQPIYGRQTPDGWPDSGEEWMNAGAILARINFGLLAAGGRLPGARLQQWPALSRVRAARGEERVDIVIAELLGGTVSRETREILTTGANPLAARAPMAADSLAVNARGLRLDDLQQVVGLALGAPEFQRR